MTQDFLPIPSHTGSLTPEAGLFSRLNPISRNRPSDNDRFRPQIQALLDRNLPLGSHRQECLALAQEQNAEMFFEGLLQLGTRLERDEHGEAAAAAYQTILENADSSRTVREAAERRLHAMSGTGASGDRAEYLLRRLARESMEPATLFGFGAARFAFNATRFGLLARFAGNPSAPFLARVLGAPAAANLGAWLAEGAVFPLATRMGHSVLGRNLDWSTGQLGRELASSYLMLGALRGIHGAGAWLRRGALGHIPSRWINRIAPQAEMLAGIYLAQHAEMALDLRPHADRATALTDSLAMLLQFNVAGRLAGHVMGEGFEGWTRELNLRSRRLVPPSFTMPPAMPGGEFLVPAGVAARPRMILDDGVAWMIGGGEGEGGGSSPGTGPKQIPPAMAGSSRSSDPFEVTSFGQLMRKLADPEVDFRNLIQQNHVIFRFKGEFPSNLEAELNPISRYLNILATSSRVQLRLGRRLVIHSTATHDKIVFSKSIGPRFEISYPGRPAKPTGSAESTPLPAPPPLPALAAEAPKERISGTAFPRVVISHPSLPQVIDGIGQLQPALKSLSRSAHGGEPLIILEGWEADIRSLSEASEGVDLKVVQTVQLLVPQSRLSFMGRHRDGRFSWERIQSNLWSTVQGRAFFDNLTLRWPEEMYLQIQAHARDRGRTEEAETTFKYSGPMVSRTGFANFILAALNHYRLVGRSFTVELPEDGPKLSFLGRFGRWQSTSIEPSEPPARMTQPPEVKPPEDNRPSQNPTRTRAALMRSTAIPITLTGEYDKLPRLLRRAYDDRSAENGPRIIIREPSSRHELHEPGDGEVFLARLNRLSKDLAGQFDPGTVFQLFDSARRTSFVGHVSEASRSLDWSIDNGNEWRVASLRAVRTQGVRIKNPVELYLYLQALPNPTRNSAPGDADHFGSRDISLAWDGPAPRIFQFDLKEFVNYCLITHSPYGRRLVLEFEGSEPIRMENYRGSLWMEMETNPEAERETQLPPNGESES